MQNSSLTLGDFEQTNLTMMESKATKSGIETSDLPSALTDLYSVVQVNSRNDAFVILLHAFMLDVGFCPKDIPESQKLKLLPKNWREKELYSIVYCHSTCPEFYCSMTCFPLSQQLSVFGTVTDGYTSKELPNICLQVNYYVSDNVGSPDPSKIFVNVKELSQSFKDGFAYPLLAAIQEALGFGPTFGLAALMDEVKMQILSCLPVGGLVAMSYVNKEFYELCNSPSLWKKLCLKDFHIDVGNTEDPNQDWKKLYKEMYLKQKYLKQRQQQHSSQGILLPHQTHFWGTREEWHPPISIIPPEFGPDFPFGIREMRVPFSDLQPEARPHNVTHSLPFPHNPLLKLPHIFHR